MCWKHFDIVSQRREALVQRVVDRIGIALGTQIRTARIPDEQRVAGQDEPRFVASCPVDHREADAVGRVTRRMEHAYRDVAEVEHYSVFYSPKSEQRRRALVEAVLGSQRRRERTTSGNVVSVHVGVDHVENLEPERLGDRTIGVEVSARVNDGADAATPSAEDVGRARLILMQYLPKEHSVDSLTSGSRCGRPVL